MANLNTIVEDLKIELQLNEAQYQWLKNRFESAKVQLISEIEKDTTHTLNMHMIDKGMGQADSDNWFNKGVRTSLDQVRTILATKQGEIEHERG